MYKDFIFRNPQIYLSKVLFFSSAELSLTIKSKHQGSMLHSTPQSTYFGSNQLLVLIASPLRIPILFIHQNIPKITQELCMYYLNFGTNPLEDKLIRMALWDSTLVKAQQQRNVTFSIYEKRQTVLVPANL